MQETILVTGATGTVGREVIKQLSMREVHVRAGVHSIIKGENLKRLPEVGVTEINFKNPASLHAAFTHANRLFIVAPFTEGQVEMEKNLVDEAKKQGVRHIVKLSASGAEAEPGIQLGRWHREVEQYIEASGIPYTFLRPSGFMQNIVNYNADSINEHNKFYLPVGEGKVSYIDVRDIAAVAVEVLTSDEHYHKAYTLTGPEAISHSEIATVLTHTLDRMITFVDVPEEAARETMLSQQMPAWKADAMLELYGLYRAGYGAQVTTAVEEITGNSPHSFSQFAEDYKACFIPA
ncbi:SDR family oxidoreductase [Pontibacter sp. SGAir0037]|uniref:SDR family oxidoreductase n=1 Tax=Pontibacter sp. SGAir0037 TaxID=2571030 RepID=UPI0010CD6623|nr:SDR family oxidoreductase [Pontibacter sp. SGAir0037]QCR24458.1 NAD(P)-dependent oxidoreductase [Pontibacter sp. SGAir0037]